MIWRDGRYLVCRRPTHKRHGGLWEFPGGKYEPGESHLDAARRELAEELALVADAVGEVLFTRHDPGSPFVIQFIEVTASGEPVALEHSELRWATLAELRELELAPSDAEFVRWLGERGGGL